MCENIVKVVLFYWKFRIESSWMYSRIRVSFRVGEGVIIIVNLIRKNGSFRMFSCRSCLWN